MGRRTIRASGKPYTGYERIKRWRREKKKQEREARFALARERRERARAGGENPLVYLDHVPEVIPRRRVPHRRLPESAAAGRG
jgi:hypothetical protein